jgi:uncharacterized protein
MKYLLVFLVFLLIAWRWRSSRSGERLEKKQRQASRLPDNMVQCKQCGVHLPESEAIQGASGAYCSSAHLHLSEP